MSASPPDHPKAEPKAGFPVGDFIPIVHHNLFMPDRIFIKVFPADRAVEAIAFLASHQTVGAPAYVGSPVPPGVWA